MSRTKHVSIEWLWWVASNVFSILEIDIKSQPNMPHAFSNEKNLRFIRCGTLKFKMELFVKLAFTYDSIAKKKIVSYGKFAIGQKMQHFWLEEVFGD